MTHDFSATSIFFMLVRRQTAMAALLLNVLPSLFHVPSYSNACHENCCHATHPANVSQVVYLKGSGGLEVHMNATERLEWKKHATHFDVDVIFRDVVNVSTFRIHIGCGGCVASSDPIWTVPETIDEGIAYGSYEIEPFTQQSYFGLLNATQRKFPLSLLDGCSDDHFTIRLVDLYTNRTKPIVWGAVLGLAEQFTIQEIVSFPIYVIRNHGPER